MARIKQKGEFVSAAFRALETLCEWQPYSMARLGALIFSLQDVHMTVVTPWVAPAVAGGCTRPRCWVETSVPSQHGAQQVLRPSRCADRSWSANRITKNTAHLNLLLPRRNSQPEYSTFRR
jgi:hypothetical protein